MTPTTPLTPAIPLGTHCILDLHGCPAELLNDLPFVRGAVEEACRRSAATLLNLTAHQFEPQGVTVVALLADSHLSMHTWPEHGYAAADIFTCGKDATPIAACEFLARHFAAQNHSLQVLTRGAGAIDAVAHGSLASKKSQEADLCQARD